MTTIKDHKPRRGKTVSEAEFRRLWLDLSISQGEVGRRLGISGEAALSRALARGLPRRPAERPWTQQIDRERVYRLRRSGLSLNAIAALTGNARSSIQRILKLAGIAEPKKAIRADRIASIALAASASETKAAMRDAEMLDGRRDPRNTGKRAA